MEKITRTKLVTSLIIVLWILFTIWLLNLFGFTTAWPAFTVLNLLSLTGFDKQNIIKVFASSTSGIIFGVIFIHGISLLTPILGETLSVYLSLFVILIILLSVDVLFPMFINTQAFIVFTYAMVNAAQFAGEWVKLLITVYVGGGIALAGVLLIIKVITKKTEKSTSEST
jgi:hypothetical protein